MDASSKFKNTLPTTPEILCEKLAGLGVSYKTFTHPPLFTVQDSKEHQANMNGVHVKNLFLRDKKKKNFLLVAEQDAQINLKTLHENIGSDRLSFGSPDRLFQFLGVRPGAVSPLALINDKLNSVTVIFDESLKTEKTIHFHPLVNDITLGIKLKAILIFLKFTGHELTFTRLNH